MYSPQYSPQYSPLFAILVAAAALAGAGYAGWRVFAPTPVEIAYRTAAVERGSIAAAVNAAGTVNAVLTVQVGAPVSGRIAALHADFNAEVRRGQALARIDPEPYELAVARAQADLDAARGALAVAQSGVAALQARIARARVASLEAQRDAERKRTLAERGFIVQGEADRAAAAHGDALAEIGAGELALAHQEAQVENARASVRQREHALAQARADVERTWVRAPVDGVVVSRTVETGQAVGADAGQAALFTLARDLRDMQVEVAVGEADIGKVRPGQAATVTVDAFPRRAFEGRVAQVRKAPQRVAEGVAYTAIVALPNADLALLPGMSARVRIAVATREEALKVPNAALAFRGEEAALGVAGAGRVWRLDDATRQPVAVEVRLGVTDGAYTEVVGGELREGETLVLGAATALPRAAAVVGR